MERPSWLSRKVLFGTSIGAALFFMVVGVILWGGFNTAMEVTNTEDFCISCHEMKDNVYPEYEGSVHDRNGAGVAASCPDCHVPRDWTHKVIRKIKASRELFHKALGTIGTPEKFEKHRPEMAKRVWQTMKNTDSRECRNCHDFDDMNAANQEKRARKQHLFAMKEGHTCIDCHKGIAHEAPTDRVDQEYMDNLEAPRTAHKQEVPEHFKAGIKRAAAQEEKEREKQRKKRQARQERIQKAVQQAIAKYKANGEGAAEKVAAAAGSASQSSGFDVDWGSVTGRQITLFYPGQTSMEWTLEGSDHGGARVFKLTPDRCFDCHEGEEAKMGKKMVTGKKAEETPIPEKRPGIPLQVKATHDGEYLYMRFSWPVSEHVPAPFVDGGKMDPENPVKLAMMIGNDKLEHSKDAGCWVTCHHDARTMPHTPDKGSLSDHPLADRLDLSEGVTKYLVESRTEVEVEDKPRGGWDKLKEPKAIQAALEEGKFMDLLRHEVGTGETQDGYVLEQRHMSDSGKEVAFNSQKKAGQWVVTMRRKLGADGKGDIALATDKVYNVGFAIHDDYADARYHHVSLDFKLGFDSEKVEINAQKQ